MNILNYNNFKHKMFTDCINNILVKNIIVGFFQIKYLDSKNYIKLKKQLKSLNIDFLICKKTFLNREVIKLIENKSEANEFAKGNILIIYANSNFKPEEHLKNIMELIKDKSCIIPLYFFIENNFLSTERFVNIVLTFENSKTNLLSAIALNMMKIINILELKKYESSK